MCVQTPSLCLYGDIGTVHPVEVDETTESWGGKHGRLARDLAELHRLHAGLLGGS